jgi:iron complex outermembrane recepter protein
MRMFFGVTLALSSVVPTYAMAQADQSDNAAATANNSVEEVIVTAQRRSESVQKSSLAISVVGGADLDRQGVTSSRDLNLVVPSVSIAQAGAYVQTNIRGAGDFSVTALSQQAISYSIDGVVIGQGSQIGSNFYDLARVEVLKGPQGTLYGRNATGGAINLITNRPSSDFGGYVTAEYGNYDSRRLAGALNLPIADGLAARGAFTVISRDGYLSDGTDDDERRSGRLQLLWNSVPGLSLRLFGDYSHTGGKGGGLVLWPRQAGTSPWSGYSDPRNVAAVEAGTNVTVPGLGTFSLHSTPLPDSFIQNDVWSIGAELNVDIGDYAMLTVLPAYRHQQLESKGYQTSFPSTNRTDDEQSSLEVRLSNDGSTLKWVVGGFYFNDDARYRFQGRSTTDTGTLIFHWFNTTYEFPEYQNQSVAAFGEANYSVLPNLRILGGLRYTDDRVSIQGQYIDDSVFPEPPFLFDDQQSFRSWSWKGGAEYDVTPASMLFFTAANGNKSGGFFVASPADDAYDPEKLTAFTLGSRNRFLDDSLQVNLELFYWKYRDQQLSSVGFTKDALIAYITRNAGSSNPRGAELDLVWKATDADTVSVNVTYNHARFEQFTLNYPAPLATALRAGPECQVPSAATSVNGLPVLQVNCAGAPSPRTPEWSGSAHYRHLFELGGLGDIAFNGGMTFATSRYLTADFFIPETRAKDYVLLNSNLTYTSPSGKFSVDAFIRNITNEAVYQGAFADVLNGIPSLLGNLTAPSFVARTIAPPRTYGVRATYTF